MNRVFQDDILKQGNPVGGNWQLDELAELDNVEIKTIYRSPEEPSHLAWVGMWRNKAGHIFLRFPEITGNPGLEPSYAPWYGRHRFPIPGAKDWSEFTRKYHLLPGPKDAISTTRLHWITLVTRDQGRIWKKTGRVSGRFCSDKAGTGYNQRLVLSKSGKPVGTGIAVIRCRDGRIVETPNALQWSERWEKGERFFCTLRESFDDGRTWSPYQTLYGRYPDGREVTDESTEENSLLELDNGRLLVLVRSDKLRHPLIARLNRSKNGEYTLDGPVVVTDLPHAGMPSLLRTDDGVIWYWGERLYYSLDQGNTWKSLPESQTIWSYYGKMMWLGSNRLLCVTQHHIGDSPYPCVNDASIEQTTFTSKRYGVLKQTDAQAKTAIFRIGREADRNLGLRVDIRVHRAEGLAFMIAPKNDSYYLAAVVLPDNPEFERWKHQTTQEASLSYYFPGIADEHVRERIEQGVIKINPQPLFVLAKVTEGRMEVLRSLVVPNVTPETWVQIQVKVTGALIQAAYFDGSSPATYLGIRMPRPAKGGLGLFAADGSLGEFRNLSVWDKPQMIRDHWTIAAP
jgi:hypothetical protein